jgi:hypothetical protein
MTGGNGIRRTAGRTWTILLIDDVGKIISFPVSKPLMAIAIVSLVLVSAVFIFSLFSSHRLRAEKDGLSHVLDRVRADLDEAEKGREKALLRLMVLEESLEQAPRENGGHDGQERKNKSTEPGASSREVTEFSEANTETRFRQDRVPLSTGMGEGHETILFEAGERVTAKDLEVWQEINEGPVFRFQFIVQRIRPRGGKVSGYTFIVLRPGEGTGESPMVIPATTLKDGKPGVFRQGQYFSIARYKFVRGTFPDVTRMDPFKTATLFVYSDQGELFAEKTFELAEIFRS